MKNVIMKIYRTIFLVIISTIFRSNQQTQANNQCLNLIGNPNSGTRCSYDCGCDGYGH